MFCACKVLIEDTDDVLNSTQECDLHHVHEEEMKPSAAPLWHHDFKINLNLTRNFNFKCDLAVA